jgi:hypothetical protein
MALYRKNNKAIGTKERIRIKSGNGTKREPDTKRKLSASNRNVTS